MPKSDYAPELISKIILLNQVALDSLKVRTEKAIIKKFVEVGVSVLEADYGICYVQDRQAGLRLFYRSTNAPFMMQKPRKQGTQARAYKSKQPLFITDVTDNPNVRQDAKAHMRSVAVIPISYKRASYGTINICFDHRHRFSDAEKSLCEYIGNSAAQAITIYRLLKEKEEALAAKEHFLALASHELKTPITSMKVFSQSLLRSQQKNQDNSKTSSFLILIDKQINKLVKLVNDILDFSGFDSGVVKINHEVVKVHQFVDEVTSRINTLYPEYQVINNVDKDLVLMADPDRLEHIFTNLITNAVKYSSSHQPIEIHANNTGTEVTFSVKDYGVGVPAGIQKKIFSPFFQGRTGHVGGLGLGLYISKKLVDQQNGRIWVDSKVDQGSTFYFALPLSGFNPTFNLNGRRKS